MTILTEVALFLGSLVMLLIALAILGFLIFCIIPFLWREFCAACYSAFADKKRKEKL